jgi:hypothetical protein
MAPGWGAAQWGGPPCGNGFDEAGMLTNAAPGSGTAGDGMPAPDPYGRAPRLDLDHLIGDAAPDRLTTLLLCYLLLPGLLFLGGWVVAWVAIPAGLAGLAALALSPGWRRPWPLAAGMTVLCIALGLLWAGATGAHHLVYSTADWEIRDAALRDLAAGPWPVGYAEGESGARWLLRAPLGFYMPAGLIGRFAGFHAAQAALWLWTGLGFGLVLMLLALLARSVSPVRPGRAFAVLAGVFVLFHGLDLLPNLILDWRFGTGPLASWGRGGEWWDRLFQYSGHVTAILWAPNHAMPAWLLALLILRHWRVADFVRWLGFPLAAAAFYSPVASAGAAALAGLMLLPQGWRVAWRAVSPGNLLSVVFAVPICLYLVAGAERVPHGFLLALHPAGEALGRWAIFLMLEILCWAIPAALLVRSRMGWMAVLLLCVIPGYVFGPGNELTARGGMPALAVLAVMTATALLVPAADRAQRAARVALTVFGVVALGGAAMEASLLLKPAWPASERCSLIEAARQSVYADSTSWPHYLVRWPDESLAGWMREPTLRTIVGTSGAEPCWPAQRP